MLLDLLLQRSTLSLPQVTACDRNSEIDQCPRPLPNLQALLNRQSHLGLHPQTEDDSGLLNVDQLTRCLTVGPDNGSKALRILGRGTSNKEAIIYKEKMREWLGIGPRPAPEPLLSTS